VFPYERFGATSQVTTRFLYDERGFLASQITNTSRYVLRYAALKSRASTTLPWEGEDYDSSVKVLGSGDGVSENEGFVGPFVYIRPTVASGPPPPRGRITGFGTFAIASAGGDNGGPLYRAYLDYYNAVDTETIAYSVSDDGYLLKETSTKSTFTAKPEQYYLYLNGESDDAVWRKQEVERSDTAYLASIEGSHKIVTETVDIEGKRGQVVENGQGHLPAAERSLDMVDPDWATEFGEDDLLYTRAASRFESQPIKVELCSNALESFREHYEELVTDDWAEDIDELTNIAEYHIRAGCVAEITFGLPFNPLVRPGTVVHLSLPTVGWEKNVWVTSVRHTEGKSETTTEVTGEEWLL
jgi:hypothetical protein